MFVFSYERLSLHQMSFTVQNKNRVEETWRIDSLWGWKAEMPRMSDNIEKFPVVERAYKEES